MKVKNFFRALHRLIGTTRLYALHSTLKLLPMDLYTAICQV